jgi:hypothetical protein
MSPVVRPSTEVPPRHVPPRPLPPPHLPDVQVTPAPLIPQVPMLITTTWEYKHVARAADASPFEETELNTLGREGWELVGVTSDARTTHFYFKREAR